jgi:predicted DNA-binding transcriptional regulator AlpA
MSKILSQEKQRLSLKEAADAAGMSYKLFYYYVHKRLQPAPAEMFGNRYVFMRDTVLAWKANLKRKNAKEKRNA